MNINNVFCKFLLVVLITISINACGDSSSPTSLEERDGRIFVDAMLVEAVLQDFTGAKKDSLAEVNYGVLYERHGIDETDLEDLRKRFSNDPTQWSRAADSVESRLKRGRADFESLLNAGLN